MTGIKELPNSDQLKHFGAALASFGSVAMFHMPGVTPQRLLTNSAKLVNIIAGYGYKPSLASMQRCIDSAVAGRMI